MSGGKPKTPGTLRGMRRRKSGVARSTLTTPILKQVDDSTWARVDAVELEEEDPEEVNAHKLPVFSSRALPASPRTAPPSERPFSMNDATNTKWWTIRQPSPFVSARKTPTPSPAPSRSTAPWTRSDPSASDLAWLPRPRRTTPRARGAA